MIDIKLSDQWTLTGAANGDAPVITDIECFLQDVKLEALTQVGELFYDEEYGWSLMDFMQCENDELSIIEIKNRVRGKLSRRTEIASDSIQSDVAFLEDIIYIKAIFKLVGNEKVFQMELSLDRVKVVLENVE